MNNSDVVAILPYEGSQFVIPMIEPADNPPMSAAKTDSVPFLVAFSAVVAGAMAMGVSPVFVRFAEVGPLTSAFWRVGLSVPLLWLWARWETHAGGGAPAARWNIAQILAGILFAGDLIFWHLSIVNTTIANATFLATIAPVWVALGSSLFIGERVPRAALVGLAFCVAGAATLVGTSYSFAPDRFVGDLYGVVTSFFFGGYFLAVRAARRSAGTGMIMFRSSMVTAVILFVAAGVFEADYLPQTIYGAAALASLALVAHVGGQGLLAFALGHLSAVFSSLVIFIEALTAAVMGWLLLDETLTILQVAGGLAIVAGIWIARPQRS